ncbi:MAG: hypothetical protein IIB00_08260 [candidate division Zixibacteria bacterium]|nr:hypothetical protein [candidate division Zixibacteria bacterium]
MLEVIIPIVVLLLAGAGYLIRQIYIEPVKRFRLIKEDIAGALEYYANVYSNPIVINPELEFPENYSQASASIRKLGTELKACIQELPDNKLVRFVFGLPSHELIREASKNLIGISNGMSCNSDNMVFRLIDMNHKRRDEIREFLRIKP